MKRRTAKPVPDAVTAHYITSLLCPVSLSTALHTARRSASHYSVDDHSPARRVFGQGPSISQEISDQVHHHEQHDHEDENKSSRHLPHSSVSSTELMHAFVCFPLQPTQHSSLSTSGSGARGSADVVATASTPTPLIVLVIGEKERPSDVWKASAASDSSFDPPRHDHARKTLADLNPTSSFSPRRNWSRVSHDADALQSTAAAHTMGSHTMGSHTMGEPNPARSAAEAMARVAVIRRRAMRSVANVFDPHFTRVDLSMAQRSNAHLSRIVSGWADATLQRRQLLFGQVVRGGLSESKRGRVATTTDPAAESRAVPPDVLCQLPLLLRELCAAGFVAVCGASKAKQASTTESDGKPKTDESTKFDRSVGIDGSTLMIDTFVPMEDVVAFGRCTADSGAISSSPDPMSRGAQSESSTTFTKQAQPSTDTAMSPARTATAAARSSTMIADPLLFSTHLVAPRDLAAQHGDLGGFLPDTNGTFTANGDVSGRSRRLDTGADLFTPQLLSSLPSPSLVNRTDATLNAVAFDPYGAALYQAPAMPLQETGDNALNTSPTVEVDAMGSTVKESDAKSSHMKRQEQNDERLLPAVPVQETDASSSPLMDTLATSRPVDFGSSPPAVLRRTVFGGGAADREKGRAEEYLNHSHRQTIRADGPIVRDDDGPSFWIEDADEHPTRTTRSSHPLPDPTADGSSPHHAPVFSSLQPLSTATAGSTPKKKSFGAASALSRRGDGLTFDDVVAEHKERRQSNPLSSAAANSPRQEATPQRLLTAPEADQGLDVSPMTPRPTPDVHRAAAASVEDQRCDGAVDDLKSSPPQQSSERPSRSECQGRADKALYHSSAYHSSATAEGPSPRRTNGRGPTLVIPRRSSSLTNGKLDASMKSKSMGSMPPGLAALEAQTRWWQERQSESPQRSMHDPLDTLPDDPSLHAKPEPENQQHRRRERTSLLDDVDLRDVADLFTPSATRKQHHRGSAAELARKLRTVPNAGLADDVDALSSPMSRGSYRSYVEHWDSAKQPAPVQARAIDDRLATVTTTASNVIEPATTTVMRDRLVRFYTQYAPERLANVESALAAYHGREEKMFRKLVAKYGPEPAEHEQGVGNDTAQKQEGVADDGVPEEPRQQQSRGEDDRRKDEYIQKLRERYRRKCNELARAVAALGNNPRKMSIPHPPTESRSASNDHHPLSNIVGPPGDQVHQVEVDVAPPAAPPPVDAEAVLSGHVEGQWTNWESAAESAVEPQVAVPEHVLPAKKKNKNRESVVHDLQPARHAGANEAVFEIAQEADEAHDGVEPPAGEPPLEADDLAPEQVLDVEPKTSDRAEERVEQTEGEKDDEEDAAAESSDWGDSSEDEAGKNNSQSSVPEHEQVGVAPAPSLSQVVAEETSATKDEEPHEAPDVGFGSTATAAAAELFSESFAESSAVAEASHQQENPRRDVSKKGSSTSAKKAMSMSEAPSRNQDEPMSSESAVRNFGAEMFASEDFTPMTTDPVSHKRKITRPKPKTVDSPSASANVAAAVAETSPQSAPTAAAAITAAAADLFASEAIAPPAEPVSHKRTITRPKEVNSDSSEQTRMEEKTEAPALGESAVRHFGAEMFAAEDFTPATTEPVSHRRKITRPRKEEPTKTEQTPTTAAAAPDEPTPGDSAVRSFAAEMFVSEDFTTAAPSEPVSHRRKITRPKKANAS